MFSGVGGFELGIGELGECVGLSEIDKHASAVLKYHYPNVKNYGDCKTINWSEVPDFDLLVGGSPCQDFSIAGKRGGLVGARSGLVYEYTRALEEKRPAQFVWENVRGVLSSNRGWDFAAILNQMAQAGYSLQWQVLNAKYFGVPQSRERVFVLGTRTDVGSPREVFFEQGAGGKDILNTGGKHQWFRKYDPAGVGPTVPTAGGGRHTPLIDGARIRRLTPVECERLMSWPDGWTQFGEYGGGPLEVSDTQRYRMCGNGVVSRVVRSVIELSTLAP